MDLKDKTNKRRMAQSKENLILNMDYVRNVRMTPMIQIKMTQLIRRMKSLEQIWPRRLNRIEI